MSKPRRIRPDDPRHDAWQRRTDHRIQAEVAEALLGLADPRLRLVTVTGVRATHDTREATVYFSVMGEESRRAEAEAALGAARGVLQGRIAGLGYKNTPRLRFQYDTSIDLGMRVSELLARGPGDPPS